ncbi:MAG: hypothetical protein MK170_03045 [Candidatus Thalassarchaeum sp.]|nr:hypothetical protein [Candidatus Thalassarchaeum sp.]
MAKLGTFGGTLSLIIGFLAILGWIGAGMMVDYIDSELEENCDSTTGQIGQITGWDDGECENGRDTRAQVASFQTPLLALGIILVGAGGLLIFRS